VQPLVCRGSICRRRDCGHLRHGTGDTESRHNRRAGSDAGLDVVVIDVDAHVLVCHSVKDSSGRNSSFPPAAAYFVAALVV